MLFTKILPTDLPVPCSTVAALYSGKVQRTGAPLRPKPPEDLPEIKNCLVGRQGSVNGIKMSMADRHTINRTHS